MTPAVVSFSAKPRYFWGWVGLALVLLLSWWLRARYLWVQPLDYDEGHWLMFGALVNAGHPAYTETFVGIPPLALWAIQLGALLFDVTLAVRYPMMFFSLLGIIGVFWSFQPWQSWPGFWAGLLAAVFLSFNTLYFQNSASLMAEVPAVALAVLSLAMARQYDADGKLFWLALSGLTFALSLALKIFVIFVPLLIGILVLRTALTSQRKALVSAIRYLAVTGGIWLAGFGLVLVIFVLIYDPLAMYQQVFRFRMELRQVWSQQMSLLDNVVWVGQMWLAVAPLVVGAILGSITGWRQRRLEVVLWLTWLGLATGLLIWHIPLRDRYAVLLVPPLAVLSGLGVADSLIWLNGRLQRVRIKYLGGVVTGLLLLGLVGWALWTPVKSAASTPSPDTFPGLNLDAVQYVWQNTLADDCIITDDQRFAFAVKRLVPAALSETSWARIITGWLTADDIARQVLQRHCPAVVYSDRRFQQQLPELQLQLRELYFFEITFGEDVIVYVGNRQLSRQPDLSIGSQIGSAIVLEGVDLDPPSPWQPGQKIGLAAYWTVLEPPDRPYKIFVQLRNQAGRPVANADHFPFPAPKGQHRLRLNIDTLQNYAPEDAAIYPAKGMWPTNTWASGLRVREIILLALPADLPAGQYKLYMGLYVPDTGERLMAQEQGGANDSVFITSVEIVD
ncbi:MAG: hypothetical protein JW953_15825 [Anaerolineae bacterium]|nr:hypothetical protein [Anaerolineae bacterium]